MPLQAVFGQSTYLKFMAWTQCSISTHAPVKQHLILKGYEWRSISVNSPGYLSINHINPLKHRTKMFLRINFTLLYSDVVNASCKHRWPYNYQAQWVTSPAQEKPFGLQSKTILQKANQSCVLFGNSLFTQSIASLFFLRKLPPSKHTGNIFHWKCVQHQSINNVVNKGLQI